MAKRLQCSLSHNCTNIIYLELGCEWPRWTAVLSNGGESSTPANDATTSHAGSAGTSAIAGADTTGGSSIQWSTSASRATCVPTGAPGRLAARVDRRAVGGTRHQSRSHSDHRRTNTPAGCGGPCHHSHRASVKIFTRDMHAVRRGGVIPT